MGKRRRNREPHVVRVDVYRRQIGVFTSAGTFEAWAAAEGIETPDYDEASFDGLTMRLADTEGRQLLAVILHRGVSVGVIAHEAVHLAGHVLDLASVPTSYEEDEALAYLVQYITDQLLEVLSR